MLIRFAYALRRRLLAGLRWPTRGVKVAAFDAAGRILLVRNSYGSTRLWVLPGGGVGRREDFAAAAARELHEETRLVLTDPRLFARYTSAAEGKRDEIELFTGRVSGEPSIDPREIAEARFFPLDDLPATLSPATRRRLAEMTRAVPRSARW